MNSQNKNHLCTAAIKGTEKPRRQVKKLVEIALYQTERSTNWNEDHNKKRLAGSVSCCDQQSRCFNWESKKDELSLKAARAVESKPGVQTSAVQARRNSTGRVKSESCTSVCHSHVLELDKHCTVHNYPSALSSNHVQAAAVTSNRNMIICVAMYLRFIACLQF